MNIACAKEMKRNAMWQFATHSLRGADERFISDKAQIASILDDFLNKPFYTHLVSLITK